MKRREFIAVIAGAAAAWPLAARAQQPIMPVIGYLGSATPDVWASRLQAFRQGLSEAGFDEGRNVAIEYRWAENNYGRLPELAADLLRRDARVLVAPGSAPAALAAKAATATIPIVFETGANPVKIGLVPSLNRPGGNITGVTALTFELGPKRLEILHEAVPTAKPIAALVNPTAGDIVERQVKDLQEAAGRFGIELVIVPASNDLELNAAFSTLKEKHVRGLVVVSEVFVNSRMKEIAAMALRDAVPAIFVDPQFAVAGGLMSYGGNIVETHRLAGIYTGRILKGEKPADLPVIQGTKVELVINMKTAKALGLTIPLSLLGRADQVIE
ncbi:MAG TPA: ABC transporter substrate-binding protein [Xanthobacteraceae bacterium]|jgi:putative ABC transport system substrate-binding protein|nr:ABC transporter substrate-binding protein [Xanthobacteraceae bacterium]